MSNRIIVEITYNSKGLQDIIVGDTSLNFKPIRGKEIKDWFIPFKGRVSWGGLISEIKDFLQDDEAELYFEFIGRSEYKSIFEECLRNNGIAQCSRSHEQIPVNVESIEKRDNEINYVEKQVSDEETLSKAKRMENLGNVDDAIQLYLTLAQKGNAEGQYKYAELREKILNEFTESDSNHERHQIFHYYEEAAKQGHANAMYCLANCYVLGQGTDQDFTEAAKWYEHAANNGIVMAMREIGGCYYDGIGVTKDIEAAVKWYKKALEKGDNLVARNLAKIYCETKDVEQNLDDIKKWIIISAKSGDDWSQWLLGDVSEGSEAIEWLKKSANQGNEFALYSLGMRLYYGDGVAQNDNESFLLFNKASDAGILGALYYLGMCYYNGYGTNVDYNKAFTCFEKVVSQYNENDSKKYEDEYSKSLYMVGNCYLYELGIEENEELAVEYFKKSAEYNNTNAIYLLGECYDKGYGVIEDRKIALDYYKRAADEGDTEAQCLLGERYKYGYRAELNKEESFRFYKMAADQGNSSAQYELAQCYLDGDVIGIDEKTGVELLFKSAEQNNTNAMRHLGLLYRIGNSLLEKNNTKAIEWYTKAAELNDSIAQYFLAQIYDKGEIIFKDMNKAVYWYQKAAEQDYSNAQYALAFHYAFGQGINLDEEMAFYWLKIAGDNYCDEYGMVNELLNVSYLYNYLLFPEDIKDQIKKDKTSISFLEIGGIGVSYLQSFIVTPFAGKKHYTKVIKTDRGKEMLHFYQEAANKGSKEAQIFVERLNKLNS